MFHSVDVVDSEKVSVAETRYGRNNTKCMHTNANTMRDSQRHHTIVGEGQTERVGCDGLKKVPITSRLVKRHHAV